MSTTLSIGKVCAIASTALLMGGYVWHQSRNGESTVAGDTTTGKAIAPAVVPGSQPEVLPGSKSSQMVLPGSKDALVFDPSQFKVLPGSKSDSIDFLPGSKSRAYIIPVPVPSPKVLPGSKSFAPFNPPPVPKKRQSIPAPAPEPNPPRNNEQATTATPSPTSLPSALRSRLPMKIDPAQLKKLIAEQEARLRKELETRTRLEQKQKQSNDQARPE